MKSDTRSTLFRTLRATFVMGLALAMPIGADEPVTKEFCSLFPDASCLTDTLEVVFDATGASVLRTSDLDGDVIEVEVFAETSPVSHWHGWSFGASHDPDVLEILPESVTVQGTDTANYLDVNHYEVTRAAAAGIAADGPYPPGFFQGVVLSFVRAGLVLPADTRLSLAKAAYRLVGEVPDEGVLVWLEDNRLRPNAESPPVRIRVSDGATYLPQSLTHGLILPAKFQRGDSNDDGRVDLSDALFNLGFLFLGREEPSCDDAADANDDGRLDLTDAVFLLSGLFLGGESPPSPAVGECDGDPTPDGISCGEYRECS